MYRHCEHRQAIPRRRGTALVFVIFVLGLSMVLSIAFLRTQTTAARSGHSRVNADHAGYAARTGLATAVASIRSADWSGVGSIEEATLFTEPGSTTRYEVRYLPVTDPAYDSQLRPWLVAIESTGIWESTAAGQTVQKTAAAVMQLQLRSDSAGGVLEAAPNPANYDTLSHYALVAHGSSSNSLVIDPATRVHGNLLLNRSINLYNDPKWSSSVRTTMLQGIGEQYGNLGNSAAIRHPHPLGGRIDFVTSPGSQLTTDLAALKVPYTTVSGIGNVPTVNYADWAEYRLYDGGPVHSATTIGNSLSNVTLRPTPDNPLGIFYCSGSLALSNNVDVQGTLVCTSRITATGTNIRVSAYNWRGQSGDPEIELAGSFGRLPAIVANQFQTARSAQCTIEGAILLDTGLRGGGAAYQLGPGTDNWWAIGIATAQPKGHPYSEIQLIGTTYLSGIDASGKYSIRLDDGADVRWCPIVGIDQINNRLTVLGEIDSSSVFVYKISRTKTASTEIVGPVIGQSHDLYRPDAWVLSESSWSGRRSSWESTNGLLAFFGLSLISFPDWLADKNNFYGWGGDYSLYGLPLEPVYHLHADEQHSHRFSPPLFQPYLADQPDHADAGYRWSVVAWREPS